MARQILGKVVPTGEDTYDNNRTYDELCIVMYNGQSYISKKETRGNKPDNTEYWQQLVEKPVKGNDYFTEADKDEIVNDVTNDATNKYNQAVTTGIGTFNQNAERKTSDFNDNASEKTDTYNANADSTTQAFTNNANSKTEAYNTNATEKLGTYNSNHTAKLKEYNDNATSKLSAYNTNTVTKTTEYNSNHTDKLNAYDTNASNKVDVYNTNADTRLEEYNTNADNKIAEYDEHSKELNNKIISIGNDYRMVKDQLLYTGEATDTFIHVEDSAMAEMKEIKVDGVLQQKTTQGYNILDENSWENGYHVTGNSINTSNSGCHVDFQKIGSTTQYFIRIEALQNCRMGRFFSAFTNESQDTSINKVSEGIYDTVFSAGQVKYITVNVPDGAFYVGFSIYSIQKIVNGEYVDAIPTYKNYKDYFKICISTTYQKDYEPYTGGQPSPNPDFPQEIKTITGSLKITSCEKNLFNFDNMLDNMAWNENGLVGNSLAIAVNKHQDIHSSAITFSVDFNQNSGTQGRLLVYDKNKTLISNNAIVTFPFTKVFESNAKYYTYYFLKNQIPINSKIQLELSNTASEYENYVESQIQANLPENEFIGKLDETHKDILRAEYFPEKGQYHLMLDKMVGKKIFSSDDNWNRTANENDTVIFSLNNNQYNLYGDYDNNAPNFKSNYFMPIPFAQSYRGKLGISWWFSEDKIRSVWILGFGDSRTLLEFKDWLSNNQVEVYYPLAKPYTIDLGAIDMPMSYKDITNIFTDSDLLPTINAKYYRVFDKTIQNAQINEKTLKQEITDLNATVSALDNRLKALENKTTEEPTESEGTV